MNFRSLKIGLALLGVFLLSFAIMWEQRDGAHPTTHQRDAIASRVNAPETASQIVTVAEPQNLDASAVGSTVSAPRPVAAPSPGALPQDDAAPEMPVDLRFRQRPDLGRMQGSVVNKSGAELVIDATVVDPNSKETARVQLDVPAYGSKPFGVDDGLDMQSGNQITLESSPYRDKSTQVP